MSTPQSLVDALAPYSEVDPNKLELTDGSRVGVIGGGPSGSFTTYFLLEMAERIGLEINIDIYEPRDFTKPGPVSCNMCGGIISESLVQALAAEGINLPESTIQRGIDSYVLHMDVGSVRIDTPLREKRIGAMHRGAGPRDLKEAEYQSFDGFLQSLAVEKGANILRERVTDVKWVDGKPEVFTKNGEPQVYDLLVVAAGVNSRILKLFEQMDIEYQPPVATKAYIREYRLGSDTIERFLGSSMHVFLLDIPRLEFAAIIPKGQYASLCLLGDDIDAELIESFISAPEVKSCMPADWQPDPCQCNCSPRINLKSASQPYDDRLVFIGDCAVTRLYKDGIGGAYRAAKAAATTAILHGIAAQDFEEYYWPTCQQTNTDNNIGKLVFWVARLIQQRRFARKAMLEMTAWEQKEEGRELRMSMVLWDMFTGSAPYKEILMRTLNPVYLVRLFWELLSAFLRLPKSAVQDWRSYISSDPSVVR